MKIEIDTERPEDLETQVMEMETQQLLQIYDFFADNPTLFQRVSNELMFRRNNEVKLESLEQVTEINRRLFR
jgi:hypothetical protein